MQTAWRAAAVRREYLGVLRYWRAAVKVQAAWRGHSARQLYLQVSQRASGVIAGAIGLSLSHWCALTCFCCAVPYRAGHGVSGLTWCVCVSLPAPAPAPRPRSPPPRSCRCTARRWCASACGARTATAPWRLSGCGGRCSSTGCGARRQSSYRRCGAARWAHGAGVGRTGP